MNTPDEPLPPLTWEKSAWSSELTLDCWSGFRLVRHGEDPSAIAARTDGTVWLEIDAPDKNPPDGTLPDGTTLAPSAGQIAAYRELIKNCQTNQDAILKAIFETYPEHQKLFGFDETEAAQFMPDISEIGQLRELVNLRTIHILAQEKDGLAYVGFELECTWDDEHGIGAMTHGNRLVKIGEADASFDIWIARKDAGISPDPEMYRRKPPTPAAPAPVQLDLWADD